MTELPAPPLVTFALVTYNQKRYIREAVEAALSQDYEPLEIVLSDDCSTDGTFETISEMAKLYRGPKVLIVNRNARNLGIGDHLNKVMAISSGELIVVAAGDDISRSSRASQIVNFWIKDGCKSDALCSNYERMDQNSVTVGYGQGCVEENMAARLMAKHGYGILGATGAWTRRLWVKYGDLHQTAVHEDQIIPFRASMMGGVTCLNEVLVRYREGVSTWVPRGKTDDSGEMMRRTAILKRNGVATAAAQLIDALVMQRFDLIHSISRRIDAENDGYRVAIKELGIVSLIMERLTRLILGNGLTYLIVKVKFPWLYKMILRQRN